MQFVHSELGDDPIVVEGYFAASPAQLFEAWTDPTIVMKWFGPEPNSLHSASIDLRPGGAWQFLKTKDGKKLFGFEGEYLVIEPGVRLQFTWSQVIADESGRRENSPHSKVEVVFTPKGSGTDLRVVHSAMHSEAVRRGFAGGWEKGIGNLHSLF